MIKKISKNIKETEKIAKEFMNLIFRNENLLGPRKGVSQTLVNSRSKKSAVVICLHGDLGTGKTTFSQFVAKNLGVKRKVNSPTFVIMKRYMLKHKNFKNLFHLDAYRLKNHQELLVLGWEEIISKPENLILIEWPENVIKAIPKKHHKIHISHLPRRSGAKAGTKEGHRSFKIKNQ